MFAELSHLKDNWDNEGAPAPTQATIDRAKQIAVDINNARPFQMTVRPDVLGGTSLFFDAGERTAWLAFMNNNTSSIILDDGEAVTSLGPVESSKVADVVRFLSTPEHA